MNAFSGVYRPVLIVSMMLLCVGLVHANDNGNHVEVIYQGNSVLKIGGVRQLNEVRELLWSVNEKIENLEQEAENELRMIIQRELPSDLSLKSFSLGLSHHVNMDFYSRGGGEFQLDVRGLAIHANARFDYDPAPWLGDGWARLSTSHLDANGTYDLYSGVATATLNPPQFTIDSGYSGLIYDIINFVSFGSLSGMVDDFKLEIDQSVNQYIENIVESGLNSTSVTFFGVGSLIPQDIIFQGVNVGDEIHEIIQDIPSGKIVSASYLEYLNKYHTRLTVTFGNDLTIILTHKNPNGSCTGSCRE